MSDLTRRQWLLVVCGTAVSAAPKAQQSFVVFLIDDLGWTDGGCFGSSYYRTPNIDRLCSQGVRFTNAYAAAPVCSPTRASILTGKYPARLGMTDIIQGHPAGAAKPMLPPEVRTALPLPEVTIAEALKADGYATASIGKWHLGADGFHPVNQGFDLNAGGNHRGMTSGFFYPEWKSGRTTPRAAAVARRLGLSEAAAGIPLEGQPGEYLTDRLTDAAVDFIRANRERPFFLLLSHYAVHIPIQARQNLVQVYEGRRNPASPHRNPDYAAMLESVDISVGRVMRSLEEFGLAERTSIIFTSDNGGLLTPQAPRGLPPTSNHPLREGKGHLYEGGIRVPLIITWPGVANPGSVCKDAVISTDFFPTIIDMAGASPGTGNPADGVSLAGLLKRTGKLERDTLYWHWPHYAIPGALPASAIRRGNYKLIEFLEDGRVELYNLAEDIGEQRNLAPQLRRKSEELLKALQLWRHSMHAGLMRPNPNYRP